MRWPAFLAVNLLVVLELTTRAATAQPSFLPAELPAVRYHLTARPWRALAIAKTQYLDRVEAECRFWTRHQDASGAVIDPFTHTETEYATPYFANALGTLLSAGRALDLLPNGRNAMAHATQVFASGAAAEFWIAPLTEALELYAPYVAADELDSWKQRLRTAFSPGGNKNNWRTYFMKGQWLRARASLITPEQARSDVETYWQETQQAAIGPSLWNLYHDHTTHPDTLAVETVGRGNLLALAASGYDGASAAAITGATEAGTLASLLLMDPSGQMPTNGRTDNHVWGDVGYQLAFETMAERAHAQGDEWLAGQYRHAAQLTFQNIERWRRSDGDWAGSFYVTKNHLDPQERVGYQPASQYATYNGSLMLHTAEAFRARQTVIAEQPAPVEIGGYALASDDEFAAAFANAGGMALELDLRGQTSLEFENYWTALGIVRFGRPGWDTRLGPSDGQRDIKSGLGVSFAPTFREDGNWITLASVPDRYQGTFRVSFAHPLLVRVSVDYAAQGAGPQFHDELVITPDGVLSTVTASGQSEPWGMTLPLLEDDGAPLVTSTSDGMARTAFRADGDEQAFLTLGTSVTLTPEAPVLSSYGKLRPVRATTSDAAHVTFVYPRSAADPTAQAVRDSLQVTAGGFESLLGSVDGTLYVGRTSAGGVGSSIDIDGDAEPDATFDASCGFILQIRDGVIAALETDRDVTAVVAGKTVPLSAYTPVVLDAEALSPDAGGAPGVLPPAAGAGGTSPMMLPASAAGLAGKLASPSSGARRSAGSGAGCGCRAASTMTPDGAAAAWLLALASLSRKWQPRARRSEAAPLGRV